MRVLLATYGSRGGVEPVVGLAFRLRELGVEVRVCAPPDEEFGELLAGIGVPLVPVGPSARALTKAAPPASSIPQRAAELIANQFEVVTAAAEGCDAMVVTGMLSTAAGALSVAEKLGIRSASATFQQLTLPSPQRRPLAYPGRPFPKDVTDNRVLWDLDAESIRRAPGRRTADCRSAVLGRPRRRLGHRRRTRRSGPDLRVPFSRPQDDLEPRDPRASDRRGRHDSYRRCCNGREAAARLELLK